MLYFNLNSIIILTQLFAVSFQNYPSAASGT